MFERGSLACVGTGMVLGAHLGARARATIERADVVFVLVSDALVERWIEAMNPDVRSLQPFYAQDRPRTRSYAAMVAAILDEVGRGRRVCAAFYGHPGVFARVAHAAIAAARAVGVPAWMEPGVSAEDCLYADLGIDPGDVGCQHHEATQFLLNRRRVDPSAWLVLWQAGVVGDRSFARAGTGAAERRLLVAKLLSDYPAGHPITLYEAATLPTAAPRIERVPLRRLAGVRLAMQTTLVLPPARALEPDDEMIAAVAGLVPVPLSTDPP